MLQAQDPKAKPRFDQAKLGSRGFGVLDVQFLPTDNSVGFACGGSGSLFKTTDGGQSWRRDRAVRPRMHALHATVTVASLHLHVSCVT